MPGKPFTATLREPVMQLKNGVIIDLYGEINGSVETTLNNAYELAEAGQPAMIVLNFKDVDYINSTGIALIVGLLARARKAKRTLTVFGLSEHYMEIFNITRLADFMSVYPDEQAVIANLTTKTSEP
ncbi:MAG: anti-sigma-factor antagonist [Chloroflexi bacterium OLB15]|nr:MAG: anti-sigma-factor antagonist [Chloroflexi bacterium OLB15]